MHWLSTHPWLLRIGIALLIIALLLIYLDFHLFLRPVPADFDQAMKQELAAAKIPGAAVLFIKNGQIDSAQGYGLADPQSGRAVTADTLFTIASISKTVTATALMTLYEDGKFALDDDINLYLPFDVRNPAYPDTPITFRMILAHTSSIRDSRVYEQYYTLKDDPILPDSPILLGDYLRDYFTPGGSLYNAKDNFTRHQPGSTYEYSNTGFGLIGFLVEQISGMPFDAYCQQAVFEPLGMSHTGWRFDAVDTAQMAIPYEYNSLLRQPVRVGFFGYPTYPDGALKTSANDFARFLSVFVNEGKTFEGQPFLLPETVKEMLHIQYPDSGEAVGLAWHFKGTTYNHTGGDPGIFTLAYFNPDTRNGMLVFTNGDGGDQVLGFIRESLFVKRIGPLLVARMKAP